MDVQNWKRRTFYPGAFFSLIPRFLMWLGILISLGVCMKLCYVGSGNPYDQPLSGPRRILFEFITKYHCLALCYLYGYHATHQFKDVNQVDYSKYLGEDWRANMVEKSASIWLCNHVSIQDVFLMLSSGQYVSYAASIQVKSGKGLLGLVKHHCEAM